MSDKPIMQNDDSSDILRQISGQLRLALANIYNSLDRLAPPDRRDREPETDLNAARLVQSCLRIMRIADNLEDAASLGQPHLAQLRNGDIVQFCQDLVETARVPAELLGLELAFRCEQIGRASCRERV